MTYFNNNNNKKKRRGYIFEKYFFYLSKINKCQIITERILEITMLEINYIIIKKIIATLMIMMVSLKVDT